jgi:hypothetical protein
MKAAAQHSTNKFGSAFTLHFICIVEKKKSTVFFAYGEKLWRSEEFENEFSLSTRCCVL